LPGMSRGRENRRIPQIRGKKKWPKFFLAPFRRIQRGSAVNSISLLNPLEPAAILMRFPAGAMRCLFFRLSNPHNQSNLHISALKGVRFWPKNRVVWQKNMGPTENI
jgi:hypothetical protein